MQPGKSLSKILLVSGLLLLFMIPVFMALVKTLQKNKIKAQPAAKELNDKTYSPAEEHVKSPASTAIFI